MKAKILFGLHLCLFGAFAMAQTHSTRCVRVAELNVDPAQLDAFVAPSPPARTIPV